MAKIIKYNLCSVVEDEKILTPVTMGWNEINEETARREAYNGEYTIEDDGQPEPEVPETGDVVTWAALNAAYQEGVDSV